MSDICLWCYITIGIACGVILLGCVMALIPNVRRYDSWTLVLFIADFSRPFMIVYASMMIYRLNRIQRVTDSNLDKLREEITETKLDCSDEWSKIDLS